jgi:hypothetical protein
MARWPVAAAIETQCWVSLTTVGRAELPIAAPTETPPPPGDATELANANPPRSHPSDRLAAFPQARRPGGGAH